MHEISFADVARPTLCSVLSLPLLDYSIGHELLLFKTRNPIALIGAESFRELPEPEQKAALKSAALICARDWRQKPQKRWFHARWMTKCLGVDWKMEAEVFRAYRKSGMIDLPTVPQPKSKGGIFHYFGAPESARLLLFVVENLRIGLPQAYDFPYGMAASLMLTHLENEGAVWVKNWKDAQAEQARIEFEKAHPESTLAIGEDEVQAQAEKWNQEHPEAPVPLMK